MASLIDLIKDLRERTGAGLMDCKAALLANDSDIEKAIDWLREKGLAKAAKKASSRIAAEGLAVIKTCEKCGKTVVLEVNCETDFVSQGEPFKAFVEEIAQTILSQGLTTVEEAKAATESLFADATVKMGEKFDLRRFTIVEKGANETVGSYIHMGGKIAVVAVLDGASDELAKQVAMHIAANNPVYKTQSEIPAESLAHELEVQVEAAKNDEKLKNKPAEVLAKILDAKVKKIFSESVLEDQAFLMDDSKTVGQVLKENKTSVLKFIRYHVGEGIEKRQEDFAAEVMKEMK